METIAVETLRADVVFTGDLLIDSSFILLPHSAPVSDSLIKSLKNWGFENVLCDGNVSLGGDIGVSSENDEKDEKSKERINENVKKAIESSKRTAIGNSDQARLDMVQSVYEEYMNYIEKVFTYYTTHKKIDKEELSDTVQDLVSFIREHRRYMLRINPSIETSNKNFLVIHSMRTTVLALAIAMQMHTPISKLIELGVTCILHEIGMLRLPPQLYMSDRKFTAAEKAQIQKHPIFGYEIMRFLQFPSQICFGVMDHHEKENGSGYPRKCTSDKITSYAKIIAVACTYEAISSPRSYKDERSTFDAIVELIQNKNGFYNDAVIKALLYTVSLYPIGSYVYLSNRKVAVVIDVNPDNPKYPIVQLLTERDKDGSLMVLNTGVNGVNISRILTKSEKNDILKIIEEKNKKLEEQMNAKNNTTQAPKTAAQNVPEKEEASAAAQQTSPVSPDGTEEIDISVFS